MFIFLLLKVSDAYILRLL